MIEKFYLTLGILGFIGSGILLYLIHNYKKTHNHN